MSKPHWQWTIARMVEDLKSIQKKASKVVAAECEYRINLLLALADVAVSSLSETQAEEAWKAARDAGRRIEEQTSLEMFEDARKRHREAVYFVYSLGGRVQ